LHFEPSDLPPLTKVYLIDLTFLENYNGKVVRATPLVLNMMPCKLKYMRKVKTCGFSAAKWFWPSIFVHFAEASKRHIKASHLLLIG
jgi:hypothetical protein